MPPLLPPALGGQPPLGAGPMAVPSANAGAMANAKSQLRLAYDIMQKALSSFPMGTDDHKSLLSIMQTMNKIAPASAEVPGVQATTAATLNQGAQKNAMMDMIKSLAPAA